MGKLENARVCYEQIRIPSELGQMVDRTITTSRILHKHQKKKTFSFRTAVIRTASAAAVLLALFTAGLNTSSAFASAAGNVPLISGIAELLTFRAYTETDSDKQVSVRIPGVSIRQPSVREAAFSGEVNSSIQEKCDAYLVEAVRRVREYKDAFLATGGTEEEFAAKKIEITVDYHVLGKSENTVSFVVRGMENWVSAYAMNSYYNLDLDSMKYLTLADILGKDYVSVANESIREQIKEREEKDSGAVFWTEEEGGFVTVDEDTSFYLNGKGQPVLVFEKYTIAPGAMGDVEFVVIP